MSQSTESFGMEEWGSYCILDIVPWHPQLLSNLIYVTLLAQKLQMASECFEDKEPKFLVALKAAVHCLQCFCFCFLNLLIPSCLSTLTFLP